MKDNEKSYQTQGHRPGDKTVHITRKIHRRRLRVIPNIPGVLRFFLDIIHETPFVPLLLALAVLWLVSSLGVYLAERPVNDQFHTYGSALWWALIRSCAMSGSSGRVF